MGIAIQEQTASRLLQALMKAVGVLPCIFFSAHSAFIQCAAEGRGSIEIKASRGYIRVVIILRNVPLLELLRLRGHLLELPNWQFAGMHAASHCAWG